MPLIRPALEKLVDFLCDEGVALRGPVVTESHIEMSRVGGLEIHIRDFISAQEFLELRMRMLQAHAKPRSPGHDIFLQFKQQHTGGWIGVFK